MEYERIQRVQAGITSPSKLRMKLMRPHHQRKKDGSNSNSSRTSPTKLEDVEFLKSSLLATKNGDFEEEAFCLEVSSPKLSNNVVLDSGGDVQNCCPPTELLQLENADMGWVKMQQISKSNGGNSSSIHPMKTLEEDLDYDSNASSSSFEFHKGERSQHNPISRSVLRPMPSKWNDAEKWIVSRQNVQPNSSKKTHLQSQANRSLTTTVRAALDSAGNAQKLSAKPVDVCQATFKLGIEKFPSVAFGTYYIQSQANEVNALTDLCVQSKNEKEVDDGDLSCTKSLTEDRTVVPAIRSVSMRDMGTEMTPIPSQEPSRTATPAGATTPLRSPIPSIPSTPRRGAPTPTPGGHHANAELQHSTEKSRKEFSEQELKLRTRREIAALGVQLGKTSITAWASNDEKRKGAHAAEAIDALNVESIEFEKRAAAWEEAENSKHAARYKREEIKIQAWESQQKAKLEAEMRRVEAQVEQMKARAQAKMVKKTAMVTQRSEEKRAAAKARINGEATRTAAQAEYIRQTGRIPSSSFICCI